MKIASVVGARPNFIKEAMLTRALRRNHHEVIIHTGQHYDIELNRVFFDQLDIPEPDYNLEVGSGTHAEQTGQMMTGAEQVFTDEKPDWVVVYGDTNSTLAGALAAAKLGIPVAHVEAGLRAYDKTIPEETNRILTDHISNLLFAPTKTAVQNLKKEGLIAGVHNTGDVMYDAVLEYKNLAEEKSGILRRLGLEPKGFLVATIHRADNADDPAKLRSIMEALGQIEELVVFPVHPRTREALNKLTPSLRTTEQLRLVDPVGYLDMLALVKNARVAVTDSGGLQKEAYFLGTPCVTCREEDEWPETIAAGANRLVGTNTEQIMAAVRKPYQPIEDSDEFGDGHAAEKIVALLETEV